jgi:hypothetical protein
MNVSVTSYSVIDEKLLEIRLREEVVQIYPRHIVV